MKEHAETALKILPPVPPMKPRIDDYSHTLGFNKCCEAGNSSIIGWSFGICAILGIICCFAVLFHHLNQLTTMLSRLHSGLLEKFGESTSGKHFSLILPLLVCLALSGCTGKGALHPPVPVPPGTVNAPAPADGSDGEGRFTPHDAAYHEDNTTAYLAVDIPPNASSGPQRGEPDELAELLEMRGADTREQTAVQLMRPAAIREAAQLVTLQTAIAWRYGQLLAATEGYSGIMDTAFNFSPLLLTQGQALIMPPVLTMGGASMRIKDSVTATEAGTTCELLEPARYIATAPTWRDFLMADDFPGPERPNPAVLPKNEEERRLWRAAVREAWTQGVSEADRLYADNVARMVRNYRGIMLYHLLTAQHLLSRVDTASADLGMHTSDKGNKLHIGQKVYRITAPSAFRTGAKARK